MTDHLTDRLFVAPGSCRVESSVSRLVVDPERFPTDEDEPMSRIGMGAIYEVGHDLRRIRAKLHAEQRTALLNSWYVPHHERLEGVVSAALRQHNSVMIVDCHSFASRPLPYEPDQSSDRPEICIGTDPFHTPPFVTTSLVESFKDAGYSVHVDRPYSGAIVPGRYYRREARVRSVMIEVRRDLYCDESTGVAISGFGRVRDDITRAIRALDMAARTAG